jgi:hypothetical protein
MKNILSYIILLPSILIIAGCNSFISLVGNRQNSIPINVGNQNILPIYVYTVNSCLIPGSIIGGHYDGMAKVKQQHYFASETISEYWQKQYVEILSEEFNRSGYDISDQNESNVLFLNQGYIIVIGSIINQNIKTYGEFGGDRTEVSLEILWQFYHSIKNNLIYKQKIKGDAYNCGIAIEMTSLDAYKNCVRNLLADSSMVNEMINYSNENSWYYQFTTVDTF